MRRAAWFVVLLAVPVFAQETGKVTEETGKVTDLVIKIIDLDFHGQQDIGGSVQDLAIKEIGNEIQIELNADVLFEFDKADLLPKAEETLKKAADVVRERGAKGTVRVEGHTDGKGDDNYNMKLSV